jgi:ketosteroid isomerase-like protein
VTTQETRELALAWLNAGFSGDFDRWLSMLDDDFRYFYCGKWQDKAGYLKVVASMPNFVKGDYSYDVGSITAEGDRVVIEAETNYDLQDGDHYHNAYVTILQFRNGKILRYIAHNDTLVAFRTFDKLGIWREVEPSERQSPIEDVRLTLEGPPA